MNRALGAATLLSILAASAACSGVGGSQESAESRDELRARVIELEKKAVVAELEIDRLRQKVAALEGPAPARPAAAAPKASQAAPATPRATATLEPETRIAAPPAIDSSELPANSEPAATAPRELQSSPPAANSSGLPERRGEPARPLAASALDPATPEARAAYDRAYALYHQGRYSESEAAFAGYLDGFATNDLSDNAVYWIGECRLARSDWNGALRSFQEAVERFPTGNKVPDALYKAGQALERLGDLDAARASYEMVVERFPETGAAERAAERLSALR